MNFLKAMTVALMMTVFSFSASAQCTATTACGDYNFPNCSSISVSSQASNGQTTVTITVDGVVAVQETCSTGTPPNNPPNNPPNGGFDLCALLSLFGIPCP